MVHQIGLKLRGQIQVFSGKLSSGMGKIAGRFVEEMIYGIQARGSVHLSEIARSLSEKTSVKKRIDRLSRNLARAGLGDEISAGILAEGAGRIHQNTLLIVDPTDIAKKYAKKMEYLARVRDGSEKKQSEGYWVDTVVGARSDSSEIIPLVHRLYSQNAGDFVSENHELLDVISKVYSATEGRGIFVVDRGGDRRTLYKELLKEDSLVRFIIRQRGDRHLLYGGRLRETFELAERCKTPYAQTVIKQKDGKEKAYFIKFGFCPVRLPEHPEKPLWLVVVKGFGEKPLMLLTTEPMSRNRKILWWIVQAYLTRWRVEDTIRFIKQSYNLEDIRVMTYQRLQNMAALVLAAAFFTAVRIGYKPKIHILALHALNASQRIFGIPDFRYYALADGIKAILSRSGQGILSPKNKVGGPDPQLALSLA
jgi:Transposase DDE domain